MSTAIRFENISKSYDSNTVVNDFNLEIESGEFVTIIGRSGCGKTTILKMVNGLITPDQGVVYVEGKDISREDQIKLRRNIGYSIQGAILFPHLNVEQNISYVPNLLNKKNPEKTKHALAKWMGIVGLESELLSRYPDELSGGQQQRVGIARCLAASPDILLMDEPFGAVDEITREQLQDELRSIHQQTRITVLFVTHDIDEALSLGTKVLVMDKGKIEQFDTPDNILQHPRTDFVKQLLKKNYRYQHVQSKL